MVFFSPFQNVFTIPLGFMTLKISQIFLFLSLPMIFTLNKINVKNIRIFFYIFILFLLFVLLSTFMSMDIQRSINLTFALILLFIVVFLVIINIKNINDINNILEIFVLSNTICFIYGLSQLLLFFMGFSNVNVNFHPWDVIPRVPFFSSENMHANFALIPSIYLFSKLIMYNKDKIKLLLLFIANFSTIVMSNSRGALVAFFTVALLIFITSIIKNYKIKISNLIILIIFSALIIVFSDIIFIRFTNISVNSGTIGDREHIIRLAMHAFNQNIFFGIGLGSFEHIIGYKKDIHGVIFQLLTETGIIATTIYVCFMLLILIFHLKIFLMPYNEKIKFYNKVLFYINFALILQSFGEPFLYNLHWYIVIGLSLGFFKIMGKKYEKN
jgi:hypothetical protein